MSWSISDLEQQPDGTFKAKANPKLAGNTQVIKYDMLIGIDTGVNTGFATYSPISRRLLSVETLPIHQAMERVLSISQTMKTKVRFEDARLRTWFGDAKDAKVRAAVDAKQQGAGSVKRDAVIWEHFLTDKNIPFEKVNPEKNRTKVEPAMFTKMTGWTGTTSNHGRDAAMLVYGF